MRTKPQNPNIDTEWFKQRLIDRKLTMRGIAKLMDLDPSSVSLMFRGIRGINNENAVKLAELFDVTPNEVFKRAGAPIVDEARTLPVAYFIDSTCQIREIPKEAQDKFTAPYDAPTNSSVVQDRTGGTHDGWSMIIDGTKREPSTVIGSLSVYCREDGMLRIGLVKRGYLAGTYNVQESLLNQDAVFENQRIIWCKQVLWIKPITV